MRFFEFLLLLVILSATVQATVTEQKDLNFKIKSIELFKGDVHYSFETFTPSAFKKKHPEFLDLDSLAMLKVKDATILMSKLAYVVNKPVGFFDHEHMSNENFVHHIMGNQHVKKLSPNTFMITIPGVHEEDYKMKSFFDSDDLSTLPNSRVIQAVRATKQLDVISQGASSTVVREMTQYSLPIIGTVNLISYIPLKENKTLVITYYLMGLKPRAAGDPDLKKNFLKEAKGLKDLIDSYKEPVEVDESEQK